MAMPDVYRGFDSGGSRGAFGSRRQDEQLGRGKGGRVFRSGYGASFYIDEMLLFLSTIGASLDDLSVPMKSLGERMANSVRYRIRSSGDGKWPPLSDNTIRRSDSHQPLIKSGDLVNSIFGIYGKRFAGARSDSYIAHIHDRGAKPQRTGRDPDVKSGKMRRRRSARTPSEPYRRGLTWREAAFDNSVGYRIPPRPFMIVENEDLLVDVAEQLIGDYIDKVLGDKAA